MLCPAPSPRAGGRCSISTLCALTLARSLFRQDRDTDYVDFSSFPHALASMLSYLLAMFDYNVF